MHADMPMYQGLAALSTGPAPPGPTPRVPSTPMPPLPAPRVASTPAPPLPHPTPRPLHPCATPAPPHPPAPLPAVLQGCKITNSVLGESSYVGRGTRIEHSLLLGNGAWMSDVQRREAQDEGRRVYGVGECAAGLLMLCQCVGRC